MAVAAPESIKAHARRKFHDAYKVSGKKDMTANEAVKRIGTIYHCDKKIRAGTQGNQSIAAQRQDSIKPLVGSFYAWLESLTNRVAPKNAMGKAVHYAMAQRAKLSAFLKNGEIPLDNNIAENAIRPYVIGRKAWFFCDSQSGAKASTNIYSIVETAKANGKEPHAYLTTIFERLPLAKSVEDFEALLPWNVDLSNRA